MTMERVLLRAVCICLSVCVSSSYKPVVFMHGILNSGAPEIEQFFSWIKQYHPGTETYIIDKFNDGHSFVNLMKQAAVVGEVVQNYTKQYPQGIHLMCFSQGGLVCRGVLEYLQHNVDTFISISCPLAGQFGDTSYFAPYLPHWVKYKIYELAYTNCGQEDLSICNYWNDPHQQPLYLKYSKFLAVINNDTLHNNSEIFRTNFLRLKKLVLIGGPDDGVITPWQSSQFGFYDENENVIDMKRQKFYLEDSFGLRTMDERGALNLHTMAGVNHTHWHTNYTVFKQFILPYLT